MVSGGFVSLDTSPEIWYPLLGMHFHASWDYMHLTTISYYFPLPAKGSAACTIGETLDPG